MFRWVAVIIGLFLTLGHVPCEPDICCMLQCVAVRYSALQAARCGALQCVAVWCNAVQYVAVRCSALQCAAVHYNALQCVVVCCSVL